MNKNTLAKWPETRLQNELVDVQICNCLLKSSFQLPPDGQRSVTGRFINAEEVCNTSDDMRMSEYLNKNTTN